MSAAPPVRYNTNLAKAQGLVPETLELLALWQPGMAATDLKKRAKETGALARASDTRITDVVTRGFAQRYMVDAGQPAANLKRLLEAGVSRAVIRQIIFVYTARHNPIFRDFVTTVYWRKANLAAGEVTKADARDFLERSVLAGHIRPRWSENMMNRVASYLLGTLYDFQLITKNRRGLRLVNPPNLLPEAAFYLAHELHFRGIEDPQIPLHPDWALFGIQPANVPDLLERAAAQGHLHLQNAGQFLRIEWKYPDMNHFIDALAH